MRISTVFTAFALVCALEMPAIAQEHTPSGTTQPEQKVLGTVVHGNTTIVFEAVGTRGIDMTPLRTWSDFAEKHPKIEMALAYKPSLINDVAYLKKHPELAAFFQTHPDIKDAMMKNPGNFVAIPPRPGE